MITVLNEWFGCFWGMAPWSVATTIALIFVILGYLGAPFWLWSLVAFTTLFGYGAPMSAWLSLAMVVFVFGIPLIRRYIVSFPVLQVIKALKLLPVISETEKAAIGAGTVWIDGELFSGKPDFNRILSEPYPSLSAEEQAFLEGPVETACAMVNDWEIHERRDFSPETWTYLKTNKFFGMIIPKEYGGLGFSAAAHSAVISKLASRSTALAITVMVPNSLGPAELLTHYGTPEQRKYYLPRLAMGQEMPCFALTEPGAGSDAGAMTSHGEIFKGTDGKLHLRLNWKKRYITLAAISTVIGLAFKLRDPQNLLGKGVDIGVTCALIPANTKGVVLGRRHDPLGVPFFNCPTEGHDVEVSIDAIIGGPAYAGKGWPMLMESLAAGRGISLPSNCVGGTKLLSRLTGAYGVVRRQFGLSIGKFEGIEEVMAEIGGINYLLEASRVFTCGAIDRGAKPAVVTAIAKYNSTELFRKCINHGMDILGGAAISRGPRNLLANPYFATPISITVEGANILTRTLIIFGQGAIRCHPYVLAEINAIESGNITDFDKAFFGHVGHVFRNKIRAIVLFLTRGKIAISPVSGPMARYYKKLAWSSAKFALYADMAMALLGGNLKRKEMLTGRFGDILSWMYLATATMRRYEADGRLKEDLPYVKWALDYAFFKIQEAFESLLANMGGIFWLASLWTRANPIGTKPSDKLSMKVARLMQQDTAQRDRMTEGLYLPTDPREALARYDQAFKAILAAQAVTEKIQHAIRTKTLPKKPIADVLDQAVSISVISAAEKAKIQAAEELRWDAIQVDSYGLDEYLATARH